ncbi:TIGR02647 family protein [Pseudomonas luteola]|uniref:TIGR02647 family protein n=1 Tax=Pseudomonas luteola TaxID=47886 RepID=UPI000F7B969E|nr:TIGR02647 family protein [Pseudomonas luteola]RRW49938.1 TIGR02647 family protein [Pseudomonas luteola]
MPYTQELIEEMNLLARYDLSNSLAGLKVHHDATQEVLAGIKRFHEKGLISQVDGGYLTGLGRDAAEHAQVLLTILNPTA